MKKIIALIGLLSLNLNAASGGNFGAGFVLGNPTGITLKLWTQPRQTALDLGVGWGGGFGNGGGNYSDPNCYNGNFYNANRTYCDDQSIYWGNFHVHGDYLIHNFNVIKAREQLPIYYGPGLALDVWRDGYRYSGYAYNRRSGFVQLGVRGVIGLAWIPHHSPFDLFLELAPVFELFPFPDFGMEGGFGGRFYF